MESIEKILIIVCIILVAGIGITSGMLLEKNSENKQPNQNNTTMNQSNQNNNSSVSNASKTKDDSDKSVNGKSSGIMSTSEAYSLMKSMVKERNGPGYTLTPPALISRNQIYHSSAYYGESGIDENYRGFLDIDSTTGEIVCYSVN